MRVRPQELVAEDLCQEDVICLVRGFKSVAADGGVGRAQVAWFPGFVQRAEGGRNVLWELRAGDRQLEAPDDSWGTRRLGSFVALRS